jgi:hypothetical protein
LVVDTTPVARFAPEVCISNARNAVVQRVDDKQRFLTIRWATPLRIAENHRPSPLCDRYAARGVRLVAG